MGQEASRTGEDRAHEIKEPTISKLSDFGAPVPSTPALMLNTCRMEAMNMDNVLLLKCLPGQILESGLEVWLMYILVQRKIVLTDGQSRTP